MREDHMIPFGSQSDHQYIFMKGMSGAHDVDERDLRSQVGGGALHAPFDWQYLLANPTIWNPSLQ